MEENKKLEETQIAAKGTRDLFMDTLTKIGCQYEVGEGEDDKIFFAYQGENFSAECKNDGWYVHLWDVFWGHVELYDVDEIARLKKAINFSNLNCGVTTVYTVDENGKTMDIHCKTTAPFMSEMPQLENYLRATLSEFFRAHHIVGSEMEKLRNAESNK